MAPSTDWVRATNGVVNAVVNAHDASEGKSRTSTFPVDGTSPSPSHSLLLSVSLLFWVALISKALAALSISGNVAPTSPTTWPVVGVAGSKSPSS
jgi:hypothetical protein